MKKLHLFLLLFCFSFSFSQTGNPEEIVQIQLDAYNSRNIDAFLDTYADNIKIYDYPNTLIYEGKDKMRKRYTSLFEKVPNLFCEIKKRIVIGNKVIDQEYVRVNDKFISAVAIYEVVNNKITKVTFIE